MAAKGEGEEQIEFDPACSYENYVISNHGQTLCNKSEANMTGGSSRAKKGWSRGIHCWEVHIDSWPARPCMPVRVGISGTYLPGESLGDGESTWCVWSCADADDGLAETLRKITGTSYCPSWSQGDTIGVLLDLDHENGRVKFFVNGKDWGWAFTGLLKEDSVIYPAVTLPGLGTCCTIASTGLSYDYLEISRQTEESGVIPQPPMPQYEE